MDKQQTNLSCSCYLCTGRVAGWNKNLENVSGFNGCSLNQLYGQSLNPWYKQHGLKGHSGIDYSCGYGTDIFSPFDGYCYKFFDKSRCASEGYTAIFILVDDGIRTFEYQIGHVSEVLCGIGHVRKGQLIGREGNSGTVFQGGVEITLAMQNAGDKRGAHRHIQIRPVLPVLRVQGACLLANSEVYGTPFYDGHYYKQLAAGNGFNGATNPIEQLFTKNLYIGMTDYQVVYLQRVLQREQCLFVEPTGYFGPATFSAVRAYQKKHNITSTGLVGPLTRAQLNRDYKVESSIEVLAGTRSA